MSRIGQTAFILYVVLCRHANNDSQQCFPSQVKIAKIMNCSVNTVRVCTAILAKEGLVSVQRSGFGPKANCIYTLLPVQEMIPLPTDGSVSASISPLIHQNDDVLSPCTDTTNKTNRTRLIKTNTSPSVEVEVEEVLVLPDWLPMAAWNGFVKMRKAIRRPLTIRAINIILKRLTGFREQGYDPQSILDYSTMNSYQNIFVPGGNGNGNGRSKQSSEARLAQELALFN